MIKLYDPADISNQCFLHYSSVEVDIILTASQKYTGVLGGPEIFGDISSRAGVAFAEVM